MSVIPLLFGDFMDNYRRTTIGDLIDQHFGMGLTDNIFRTGNQSLLPMPLRSGYMRPWRHLSVPDSGVSNLTNDSNEFKVNLDVQQFKPDELKVTVDNGYLIVDAKHEERSDEHGYISRQFRRKYKIPDDIDPKTVASKLSSDGVLTLEATRKVKQQENDIIELSITQTNQPMRIVNENKATEESK